MREFIACNFLSAEQVEEQQDRLLKSLVNIGKRGKLSPAQHAAINEAIRGLRSGAGCNPKERGASSVAVARTKVGSHIPGSAPEQRDSA